MSQEEFERARKYIDYSQKRAAVEELVPALLAGTATPEQIKELNYRLAMELSAHEEYRAFSRPTVIAFSSLFK